uniref:SPK domain-containing protein n=2 Tax=Caenorhabditis tropicalis TaxID=1561998 RepID=A0A1I7T602_9PELO
MNGPSTSREWKMSDDTPDEEDDQEQIEPERRKDDVRDEDYEYEDVEESSDDEEMDLDKEEKIDMKTPPPSSPTPSDQPPTVRSSARQRKATKRFEFADFRKEKSVEIEDEEDEYEEGGENRPRNVPNSGRIQKSVRNTFTEKERSDVFKFILSQCQNRAGRVAKMKVQTTAARLWNKFKKIYGYERRNCSYRIHYNFYSKKLHKVPGLTLAERVDLYYAMDIPVTCEKERKLIMEQYGAILNEDNIVVGSTILNHWDLTHNDEEAEDDECDKTRFVEYQDGMMWEFIVEMINLGNDPLSYGPKLWEQFRRIHPVALIVRKTALGYAERARRITVPNLHIMPFDIEAKAALYQSLSYPVPEEFREQLVAGTGAILSDTGFVVDYPTRPEVIVLQSVPITDSPIGLTSTTALSTLREPENRVNVTVDDRHPWTIREDRMIWDYVRRQARDFYGRMHRIKIPKSADNLFWYKLKSEIRTDRGCHALFSRFKRLSEIIFQSSFLDLETKLELYYILEKELDPDAAEAFEQISILVIDNRGVLRCAVGYDFLLGEMNGEIIDENSYAFYFQRDVFNRILGLASDEPISSDRAVQKCLDVERIVTHIIAMETEEQLKSQATSNSSKFPYVFASRGQYGRRKRKKPTKSESQETENGSGIGTVKLEQLDDMDIKLEPIDDDVPGPSQPPKRPNEELGTMEKVDLAFEEVKEKIRIFHERLAECAEELSEERREQCNSEIDQLVRMFRMTGKQALKKK